MNVIIGSDYYNKKGSEWFKTAKEQIDEFKSFCDKLERIIKDDEPEKYKVRIILLTRKLYHLYLQLQDEVLLEYKNCIENDRYYSHTLDYSELNNKTVYILDDTMNTGRALKSFDDRLQSLNMNLKVIPVVFLLNKNYKEDVADVNERKDLVRTFDERLIAYHKVNPREIGRFCICETIRFHENLVPYVISLPTLAYKPSDQNGLSTKLLLSKKQLEGLCKDTQSWSCIVNDYDIVADITEPNTHIHSMIFRLSNNFLMERFNGFLAALTIKCQYKALQEDCEKVEATFTPFAVMRSISQYGLLNCFFTLFEDTAYCKKIKETSQKENISDSDIENMLTAVYRAVVYNLSMYTGVNFIRHLDSCNIKQQYQLKHDSSFSQIFYDAIDEIFEKENNYFRFDEDSYLFKLSKINLERSIWEDEKKNFFTINSIKASDIAEAYGRIYEKVITTKRETINRDELLTFEMLENYLEQTVAFRTQEEALDEFLKIMNKMLNLSLLSNYVKYDKESGIVYRGFRYGENSDLILPYNFRPFYVGIYRYYKRVNIDEYYKKLDKFLYFFKQYLKETGMLASLIPNKHFEYLSNYFRQIPKKDLNTQMENKQYLLDYDQYNTSIISKKVIKRIENFADTIIL